MFKLVNLDKEYNFKIKSATEAPRGFVAETYFLDTDQGDLFVKLIKKGRLTANLNQSLQVLEWLSKQVDFVQSPVKNIHGQNWSDLGIEVAVVFSKILSSSINSLEIGHTKMIELGSNIHVLNPSKIKDHLIFEKFECRFEIEYVNHLQNLEKKQFTGVAKKLQELLAEYHEELDLIWNEWENIKQIVKNKPTDSFVITHGDIPGNLIEDTSGKIWLIDWDDLILAPKERDLWVFADEATNLDSEYYAYYLYQRFLVDLTDWMNNIFGDELSEEEKEKQFQDCKRDCFEAWLLPKIREYRKLR